MQSSIHSLDNGFQILNSIGKEYKYQCLSLLLILRKTKNKIQQMPISYFLRYMLKKY